MVFSRQVSISSFHRDAWVEIDLSAVEHNVSVIRSWLAVNPKPARLMAVVKSDAYGHGAPQVADMLSNSGAEYLGVASVDEGCQLRSASIKSPILILSPTPFWAIDNALEDGLELTIAAVKQARDIDKIARKRGQRARVHLKVDSGMHRLGVPPEAAPKLVEEISKLANVDLVSVFSHLARAGDQATTTAQLREYESALKRLKYSRDGKTFFAHLASSEAARKFPETHFDMVRVGLYLYGLEGTGTSDVLVPAMSVKGRINHINQVKEGERVGYNLTWEARRESRLACVPIGYADGVDRRLSNRMEGLLLGRKIKQVGIISMDQMLFDITDVPEAQDGDVITLIGKDELPTGRSSKSNKDENGGSILNASGKHELAEVSLNLANWAEMLDTITYELACRLRARLPRIYTRHHKSGSGSVIATDIGKQTNASADANGTVHSEKLSTKQPR
ncbi:alanine racemase [Candidatus Obscuribacterales bacterium]|nr:alanine racemase [Candidatus Obscuribacterales bacterium]